MRVAILRRSRNASISMDVYADSLISGLKAVRPDWKIVELSPLSDSSEMIDAKSDQKAFWLAGISKYYERYWRYPRSLKNQIADVFHVVDHSEGHLCAWLRHYHKRNTITCHDLINLVEPETFKGRARLPLISMLVWKNAVKCMRWADRIISVSSHTKKDIVNSLAIEEDAITVIPNAVDAIFHTISSESIARYRQQKGISPKQFCLLNVGSNHSRKNLTTVLKIISALKSHDIPVHFWKVGKNFTPKQQEYIAQNNLETDITYLGQPTLDELITIYNAADLLIAPSTYEGFGLTILEAMACGLVVLTSNVTSLPEVAGNAAILVNPLDVKTMVTKILNLYHDSELYQNLVKQGLKRSALFTWQNTAERVARIYEDIASKHI